MKNPVVGITGSYFKKDDYVRGTYAHQDYIISLFAAGAVPIILPSAPESAVEKYVQMCDGFIISGGCDVDPRFYHQNPSIHAGAFDTERDLAEIGLLHKAMDFNKPVLGICRGLQVINVALGGTLIQDIPSEIKGALQHEQKEPRHKSSHQVRLENDSDLFRLFNDQSVIYVNSLHHQAIGRLADRLVATAFSDDGIIEAVQLMDDSKVTGIQWHPESMAAGGSESMRRLFAYFVHQCVNTEKMTKKIISNV